MFDSLKQAYLPETEFPVRRIDAEKCTRCGRCYETCPCFGYRWQKGEVPQPVGFGGLAQACLNCANCVAVCPEGAITLTGNYAVKAGRYKNMLMKRMAYPEPLGRQDAPVPEDLPDQLTAVEQTIYTRRSNRLFKNKPVARELLQRILEAGRFAPSAGNNQPYMFIVITDQPTIKEFETLAMTPLRLLKNTYMSADGRRRWWKNIVFSIASWMMINKLDQRPITAMEKGDKTNNRLFFDAPAVILVLKDKRGVSNPDLDAGICAQNMVLAAHSLGLGTCYVSLPMVPLASPIMMRFRKKIGIAYPYEAVTVIAVGYPKGKIDRLVPRDTPRTVWIQ